MTNSSNLIDSFEVYVLNNPDEVKPHWVSHFIVPTANELLIKIKTKDGHSGFGLATSYTDIAPIIKPFSNGLEDLKKKGNNRQKKCPGIVKNENVLKHIFCGLSMSY